MKQLKQYKVSDVHLIKTTKLLGLSNEVSEMFY